MKCETCRGDGGWWLDQQGARLPFQKLHLAVAWNTCPSCIGGISSCCEGAVGGPGDVTNTAEEST